MPRTMHIILIGTGIVFIAFAIVFTMTAPQQARDEKGMELPLDCVQPMEVNFPAPTIKLTDIAGTPVKLTDYAGDVILLNTWATWCPPCRREMPALETFFREHAREGFTLLGINVGEGEETVIQFVNTYQLSFPIWLDPTKSTSRALNSYSLPYSIVLDRQGNVRYAWSGSTCSSALESTITPLLRQ